ncbi:MAG TPA: pitrilysin family protein [Thermoanaerobaculia bacterium]|nr:pitrilysin family protein [Thermoanaerobaculia bacterium]
MKTTLVAAMAALLMATTAGAQTIDFKAPAGGIDLPAYSRTVLPNGLVVLVMERPGDALVHARLTIRSGSAADPAGKEGLAALTAALLTTGTPTRTAEQLAAEIDFAGGVLQADAGRDATEITSEFLARDVKKQLELLADVTLRPVFAAAEVERVRAQRVAEIAATRENPESYATSQFEAALYAGTRYAHTPYGTGRGVGSIGRDDVVAFHRARYAPNEAILAIAGGVKTAAALELVRTAFGGWERRSVAKVEIGTPKKLEGRSVLVVDAPGMNQTQVRIGSTGIRRSEPDFVAIEVANAILSAGFSSRLTEEVRVNRSLTYSIRSRFEPWASVGPHSIVTFTRNATTRDIIDATFAELKKFRDGPIRESELTRAKNIVLSRNLLALETAEGLARMISTIEFHGLPRDSVDNLVKNVQAVTTESIAGIIRKHFDSDDAIVLVYTTASDTEKQLEGLGTLRKVQAVE